MTATAIVNGIQILEQHRPEKETPYHVSAEHDMIYAGGWELTEEVKKQLEGEGWEWDDEIERWTAMV